jgi:hypothetical protein
VIRSFTGDATQAFQDYETAKTWRGSPHQADTEEFGMCDFFVCAFKTLIF